MAKDPILEFLNVMKEEILKEIKPSFFIAKISKPLPNIEVILSDTPLDKDDLLIDSNLLKLNNATQASELKDALKIGDKVLITKVGELYIITSKVVNI